MRRLITPALFLIACSHHATPGARICSVLDAESQLDACVGKTVTIRGRVSPKPSIISVDVDAGPELVGKPAHAIGTLEKSGATFALKANGALAKAHVTH